MKLQEELTSKGVLSKEEFEIHSTQRYDKVMKTLNKVTVCSHIKFNSVFHCYYKVHAGILLGVQYDRRNLINESLADLFREIKPLLCSYDSGSCLKTQWGKRTQRGP